MACSTLGRALWANLDSIEAASDSLLEYMREWGALDIALELGKLRKHAKHLIRIREMGGATWRRQTDLYGTKGSIAQAVE